MDQPVAFAFFVMINDPDPLTSIERMRKDLPSQYKAHTYSQNVPNKIVETVFVLNHNPENNKFVAMVATLKQ